jgi:malate dehydrogenase (oxaloacetate-decarboxylating)
VRTRRISPYFDVLEDDAGQQRLVVYLKGIALLRLVLTNKGTAFTREERRALGLEGLLPPAVDTLEGQLARVEVGYRELVSPIDKYQYLRSLQERQELLFYAFLERHLTELLPIVYTPTVGDAVRQFSARFHTPRGLSLAPHNVEEADEVAANYPMEDVRMIVATDASAILGIGDQGYGGLAIPIGKLALYTVGGGVSPFHTLPVALDVGTDRAALREDPFYLGTRAPRLTGAAYHAFVDRFVDMVQKRWPEAVIQWEDLSKDLAFEVLERHRDRVASFNDDIQGTGAVALAGLVAAARQLGQRLSDQVVVIHGAGAGGIGVADAIRRGMIRDGLTPGAAARRVFVLDSGGLLVASRGVGGYKAPFAQPDAVVAGWVTRGPVPDLLETVRGARATALLGLSGQAGAFDEAVVRACAENTARPIVFPLSNPTSACEAAPADVLRWTRGAALVATGSPFDPVELDGQTFPIGQGNNAFIFPGLGMAAILGHVTRVSDGMVDAAADALARYTAERHPTLLYPPIGELREVSVAVAVAVLRVAVAEGVTRIPARWRDSGALGDLEGYVRRHVWRPRYLPVVKGAPHGG